MMGGWSGRRAFSHSCFDSVTNITSKTDYPEGRRNNVVGKKTKQQAPTCPTAQMSQIDSPREAVIQTPMVLQE